MELVDLLSKAMPIPFSGCMVLFDYAPDKDGYVKLSVKGRGVRAHRLAFSLANGVEISGKCVCHTCDIPSCVNPSHLFLGSHQDNMDDMKKKGRNPTMEKHGRSKINLDIARKIRASKDSDLMLSKMYGIASSTVYEIKKSLIWVEK
jgi:hypothetical protein